jgi:probable F420-dependent oxidoreductase
VNPPVNPPQISTTLRTFAAEDPGDWSSIRTVARAADAAGLDRLVLSDHVAFGENLDAYGDPSSGGVRGGKQPTGPDGAWLDPLTTISHLAAITERVRFGTNILIAALRRPVVLAKMAATIDVLSNGRLDLGVGVGWQREEYEAAGLRFEDRGALLDETVEICQTLWGEQRASFNGATTSFDGIHQMPEPRQVVRGASAVPIWVSGTINPRSMRRLARFGSGWIPWGDDAADLVSAIPRMRAALAERGLDPAEVAAIGVVGNLRAVVDEGSLDLAATMAPVGALVEAGVTDFRVPLTIPNELERATDHLGEVVSAFRAAASGVASAW